MVIIGRKRNSSIWWLVLTVLVDASGSWGRELLLCQSWSIEFLYRVIQWLNCKLFLLRLDDIGFGFAGNVKLLLKFFKKRIHRETGLFFQIILVLLYNWVDKSKVIGLTLFLLSDWSAGDLVLGGSLDVFSGGHGLVVLKFRLFFKIVLYKWANHNQNKGFKTSESENQ